MDSLIQGLKFFLNALKLSWENVRQSNILQYIKMLYESQIFLSIKLSNIRANIRPESIIFKLGILSKVILSKLININKI